MRLPVAGQPEAPPAGALRKDPFRLFFPLGVLLGWVGVGQWLGFTLLSGGQFRIIFHAMVQVQGFLACFIAGFLFTFVPRRTGTAPPAAWQLGVTAACPLLLAAFAWQERWAVAQSFWLIQLVVLLHFVLSRTQSSTRPGGAPPSLIWIPLALCLGVVGSVVTALPGYHALGKSLVLEGVVAALVMGIGAVLVPVITRAEPTTRANTWAPLWLHGVAAALFVGSFVLQTQTTLPPRLGYAVRLLIALAVLVGGARLWKWPTLPGLNRRLVLIAAWGLPLGYAVLTLWPSQRSLGLHVAFLGGFGLLALTVGQHVIVSHSGRADALARWPGSTWAMALLTAAAIGARGAMQLDPGRYLQWMTLAAISFVAAGACWLWGMAPVLLGRGGPIE